MRRQAERADTYVRVWKQMEVVQHLVLEVRLAFLSCHGIMVSEYQDIKVWSLMHSILGGAAGVAMLIHPVGHR